MERDESKFGKRKFLKGRRVDGVWVFGKKKKKKKVNIVFFFFFFFFFFCFFFQCVAD